MRAAGAASSFLSHQPIQPIQSNKAEKGAGKGAGDPGRSDGVDVELVEMTTGQKRTGQKEMHGSGNGNGNGDGNGNGNGNLRLPKQLMKLMSDVAAARVVRADPSVLPLPPPPPLAPLAPLAENGDEKLFKKRLEKRKRRAQEHSLRAERARQAKLELDRANREYTLDDDE